MTTDIRQTVRFEAAPARIYEALLDSETHAAFTGAAATISREPGGAWTAYEGGIEGRNLALVENRRIVQAWRAANWPDGVFSVVRIELEGTGDGATQLTLEHTGLPEEGAEHIDAGWAERYWQPLASYLAP